MSLQLVLDEFKAYLGADEFLISKLHPTIGNGEEFLLDIRYKLSHDYYPESQKIENILGFFDKFFTHLADRICYGEIKTLRERTENLLNQIDDLNEEIQDLKRYKIAYELRTKC